MARKRKHKDVEFMVVGPHSVEDGYFDTASEAASVAVARSIGYGGEPVEINVLVSSKAGAKWYGGDYAVGVYEEDPEASVHERIVVRAESIGRIP